MQNSFTYYLTIGFIKFKGLKNIFRVDPVDYKRLRNADVTRPKGSFFNKYISKRFSVLKTEVTEITIKPSIKLLVFIHGGAFVSGPGQHHWDTIKRIAKKTNYIIWLCNYPKAPEYQITEISNNIDSVYAKAIEQYKPDSVVLMGDSVGGTLITALTQRLVIENKSLPKMLLLISPVMDASMTNKAIEKIDNIDPMLSQKGLLSAKKMCAENEDVNDVRISPIHGSFNKFPKTIFFLAERDITYPDQKLAFEKAKKAAVDTILVEGKSMPHIWPLLPVMKEAKFALKHLITLLKQN